MNAPIPHDWLARQFAADGQRFPEDVTSVQISMVLDVHYGALELTVAIYGSPLGEAPIMADRIENLGDVIDEVAVLNGEPIPVDAVLSLFEPPERAALLSRGDRIAWVWNPDCENPAPTPIDVRHPERTLLFPMEQ